MLGSFRIKGGERRVGPDGLVRAPDGHLMLEGLRLGDLAAQFGTPLYVMHAGTVRSRLERWRRAMPESGVVYYAAKAFLCRAMVSVVAEAGASLDVVSGGELLTARLAGLSPDRIAWHGNVKTDDEMDFAMDDGVGVAVVDSLDEIARLDAAAGRHSRRQTVWIRLNLDVAVDTHAFIRTGHAGSKFGLAVQNGSAMKAVRAIRASSNLDLTGYHAHIGSQLTGPEVYRQAGDRLMAWAGEVDRETGFWPDWVDLGGGMAVSYADGEPELRPDDVVPMMLRLLGEGTPPGRPVPRLAVEPGRSVAAPAGLTLYRTEAVKRLESGRRFLMLDGGMGDNIRPALYQAKYTALAVQETGREREAVTLAGRYCESGDVVAHDVELPRLGVGDLVAVLTTGAYNYSMAMTYNRVPRPAVVAVDDGRPSIWVRRETWADVARLDEPQVL